MSSSFLYIRIPKTASSSICNALGISPDHKTALQWRQKLGYEDFNKRIKFTVVRDPYDRFISMCKFFKVKPEKFHESKYFKNQVDYIYINGKLAVDYIGKFEQLNDSFEKICKLIGVEAGLLPHKKPNRGPRLNKEDIIPIVNKYYKKDFQILGYKML